MGDRIFSKKLDKVYKISLYCMNFISRFGAERHNREIGKRSRSPRLHKPMRSRRRNAEKTSGSRVCALRPLGNREGEADDDAEPEDLPNLVRRSAAPHGGVRPPLHPAMDRTAGFFSCEKAPSAVDGAFVRAMPCEVGSCVWGNAGDICPCGSRGK